MQALTKLDLESNNISGDGIQHLGIALQTNKVLFVIFDIYIRDFI